MKNIVTRTDASGSVAYFARVTYHGKQITHRARDEAAAVALAEECRRGIERAEYLGVDWVPPWKKRVKRALPKALSPTLAEFAARFMAEWVGKRKCAEFYQGRIKRLCAVMGEKRIDTITTSDVQRMFRGELDRASKSTANHSLNVLRIMFSRAIEWGLLTENVAKLVKKEKLESGADRFLYAEQAARLLDECPPWMRPIVETALATGMRRGELLSLTWRDHVDLERRVIRLEGHETKSKRGRSIPINGDLLETLKRIPRSAMTDNVFHKGGQAITVSMLQRPWIAARDRAGLPDFRFHDLRHCAASWLVMRKVPIYEVQALLGHSTPTLTQRYSHLAPGFLRSATAALEGYGGPSRDPVNESVNDVSAKNGAVG